MENKSRLKALHIGEKTAQIPIIQGGMGVGISRSSLAGAVAREGGIGIISTAQIGYDEEGFANDQQDATGRQLQSTSDVQKRLQAAEVLSVSISWWP